MATVSEIRNGLAQRLRSISGLNVSVTMPTQVRPPAAVVMPRATTFDVAMVGDGDTHEYDIHLYVAGSDWNRAQTALDPYLSRDGQNSIRLAVDEDPTLGGVAHGTRVLGFINYASVVLENQQQFMSAVLQVRVET